MNKNYIKLCDFGWYVKLEENEIRNTICGTYGNAYLSYFKLDNKTYAIKSIEKQKLTELEYNRIYL